MRSQLEKNRLIVEDGRIELWTENRKVYEASIMDLFWYSSCYPWDYSPNRWELQPLEDTEEQVHLIYKCGRIQADVRLCTEQREMKVTVAFTNIGHRVINQFSAGMTMPVTGHGKNKVTIPHLIYNDNPSADPERTVAHIGTIPGKGIIVEEHRLPIPAVNMEWRQGDFWSYLTLLSKPNVTRGAEEEYWSLGVVKEKDGERILSLSGPLMFNGKKDVVYGGRCTPLSYMKGYRCLRPGEPLEKTYYLSWGQMEEEGKGFRDLVDVGYRILKPKTSPQHTFRQMIAYKKQVMDTRFYQDEACCGYMTFGSANSFGNISGRPEFFLYGWTGQSLKLSWCDCMLGIKEQDPLRLERGIMTADFFVKHGESGIPGLYQGYYVIESGRWQGDWKNRDAGLSSRIEGESISDLVDLMILLRTHQVPVPKAWEDAVNRACAFLMEEGNQTCDGIYPLEWRRDGSAACQDINASGMPCVLALTKASEYFQNEVYLDYARKKYEIYARYHMDTFDIPFARSTMDARCEDKEAGLYFFVTAAELYRLTQKQEYRNWAEIAADWILTFVFFWETGFQKGTLCAECGFHTTGWPGVSVQNHHLDVFFPTYELYAFGKRCGNERLMEMARHVSDALTHGVCTKEGEWGYTVIGEQGEQYYQTNYFQLTYPVLLDYLEHFRGGMQVWNPSWITALVMGSALRFFYWEGEC